MLNPVGPAPKRRIYLLVMCMSEESEERAICARSSERICSSAGLVKGRG